MNVIKRVNYGNISKQVCLLARFNETQPTPELTAEDAFDMIRKKAHQQFKDISQVRYSI